MEQTFEPPLHRTVTSDFHIGEVKGAVPLTTSTLIIVDIHKMLLTGCSYCGSCLVNTLVSVVLKAWLPGKET